MVASLQPFFFNNAKNTVKFKLKPIKWAIVYGKIGLTNYMGFNDQNSKRGIVKLK